MGDRNAAPGYPGINERIRMREMKKSLISGVQLCSQAGSARLVLLVILPRVTTACSALASSECHTRLFLVVKSGKSKKI